MRISVFGLGYVGVVSAACFARRGHQVIGVDPNEAKVELVNRGVAPLVEAGLSEILAEAVEQRRLRATPDPAEAVRSSDLSLVCVGTPSRPNGSVTTDYLEQVAREIGTALRGAVGFHVVVVRSTVLPGTTTGIVRPMLEARSGKRAGEGFGLCFNPEFLREGSAVQDFDRPPKTVIGEAEPQSGDRLAELYADLDAPLLRVGIPVAEMVKYADNAWHGLKIGFANELGNVAKALGIDSHEVMDLFCRDTKLNLSPAYLRPGQAFGGSCLPKDLRALNHCARALDLEVPILSAILPSNRLQVERALDLVLARGKRRVGVLGFSFKAGTDDLRESPTVELIERLIGKGFDVQVYDRNVNLSRLMGANRDFILKHVPHISRLMTDEPGEILERCETIVIGTADPDFGDVLRHLRADQVVIDLVRIDIGSDLGDRYDGICW